MNQLHFPFSLLAFLLLGTSCGPNKPADPATELADLKQKVTEYNSRIVELESLLSTDSTGDETIKKSKIVQIETLDKMDFNEYIELQGMVDAEFNLMASPQMPGVVTSIFVKIGDQVRKGKVLATLDGSTIRQGMEEVRTGLSLAETMYNKQKELWEQNIGSETQFLQAKNQKQQLEERLKSLQTQLNLTQITAPVDGVVDEVKLKIGEMASPGFTGIRVVNDKSLSVKAKVSDLYAGKIKKGDKVNLFFPDQNKMIQSTISYAGQTVNLTSRTVTIESKIPTGHQGIKANQMVKMKINNGIKKNSIVVPNNLIQTNIDGEFYVLVAEHVQEEWVATKKIIKPDVSYNGFTVISDGLKVGELLITQGFGDIVDGQKIRIL
ncbi:MAG: efflux RND transporter periplasmic adaptor subunit [Saprospiraceae bacterium]|nr:efflux RND transporter periplasmic adaptor subunit [Saprospiraceae bacterium]